MTHFSKMALCALVISASAFTSCSKDDEAPAAKPSIYARLGGTTMVQDPTAAAGVKIEQGRLSFRSVVDSTVVYIVADIVDGNPGNLGAHFTPLANEVFGTPANTTNLAKLSDNLTDFFSFNTGGTNAVNTYSGLGMVEAHNPVINVRMGAVSTNADYDRFEGFVGQAAVANGVPAGSELYNDVVAVLESLRDPIVQ